MNDTYRHWVPAGLRSPKGPSTWKYLPWWRIRLQAGMGRFQQPSTIRTGSLSCGSKSHRWKHSSLEIPHRVGRLLSRFSPALSIRWIQSYMVVYGCIQMHVVCVLPGLVSWRSTESTGSLILQVWSSEPPRRPNLPSTRCRKMSFHKTTPLGCGPTCSAKKPSGCVSFRHRPAFHRLRPSLLSRAGV